MTGCPPDLGPTQTWNLQWHLNPGQDYPVPMNVSIGAALTAPANWEGATDQNELHNGNPQLCTFRVAFTYHQPACLYELQLYFENLITGTTFYARRDAAYSGGYPFTLNVDVIIIPAITGHILCFGAP